MKTVVDDLKCGVIADLTTPRSCGEAINRIFSDPSQLNNMRANLHARRDEFLWKRQGDRLIRMYEAIGIDSKKSRAA